MRPILATAEISQHLPPLELTARAEVCSRFKIAGIGWELYDGMMTRFDFPRVCAEGLVCQFAGPMEDGWFMANAWISREHSETYFRDKAMPRIESYMLETGDHPDLEPDSLRIESLMFEQDARRFSRIGEDVGGTAINVLGHKPVLLASDGESIDRAEYAAAIDPLGLTASLPAEMIARMHGTDSSGGWWAQDIWISSSAAAAHVPAIYASAKRIELRRIAINPAFVATSKVAE